MKKSWTQLDKASSTLEWARCSSSFPEDQTHFLQPSGTLRKLARPTNTDEKKLERLVQWLQVVTFRLDPDPRSQHTHAHWKAGRTQTGRKQGDTTEHRLWSHRVGRRCVVVVLTYTDQGDGLEQTRGRVLRTGFAQSEQNCCTWVSSWRHSDTRYSERKVLTDATIARAIAVRESVIRVATCADKVLLSTTEGDRRHAVSGYRVWQGQPCRHWHEVLEPRRLSEMLGVDQRQG